MYFIHVLTFWQS